MYVCVCVYFILYVCKIGAFHWLLASRMIGRLLISDNIQYINLAMMIKV